MNEVGRLRNVINGLCIDAANSPESFMRAETNIPIHVGSEGVFPEEAIATHLVSEQFDVQLTVFQFPKQTLAIFEKLTDESDKMTKSIEIGENLSLESSSPTRIFIDEDDVSIILERDTTPLGDHNCQQITRFILNRCFKPLAVNDLPEFDATEIAPSTILEVVESFETLYDPFKCVEGLFRDAHYEEFLRDKPGAIIRVNEYGQHFQCYTEKSPYGPVAAQITYFSNKGEEPFFVIALSANEELEITLEGVGSVRSTDHFLKLSDETLELLEPSCVEDGAYVPYTINTSNYRNIEMLINSFELLDFEDYE